MSRPAQTKPIALLDNARFYILALAFLASLLLAAWLRLSIANDQLYIIRLEQLYGLAALVLLYLAMIISPLQKALGSTYPLKPLIFCRRAIGVSAAYFASLHFGLSVWGQLGGLSGLVLLPDYFAWSLAFGFAALTVLWAMAATSFDRAIRYMTFPRWKWLQRLVYMAGILILVHIWMIGSHSGYLAVQIAGFTAVGALLGLEALRLGRQYAKGRTGRSVALASAAIWLAGLGLLAALPLTVDRYHQRHSDHDKGQQHQHKTDGGGHE